LFPEIKEEAGQKEVKIGYIPIFFNFINSMTKEQIKNKIETLAKQYNKFGFEIIYFESMRSFKL
jgi:hypothetical protein